MKKPHLSRNSVPLGESLERRDLLAADVILRPANLTAVGNDVYFTTERSLWKTDAVTEQTRFVRQVHSEPYHASVALSEQLLFVAQDSRHGVEPWISDGTAAGTNLLLDISPGAADSFYNLHENCLDCSEVDKFDRKPFELFHVFDDKAYFRVRHDHGYSLWTTDGTAESTVQVFKSSASPVHLRGWLAWEQPMVSVNDEIYFEEVEGEDYSIWKTNGSVGNRTQLLKSEGLAIHIQDVANEYVYFTVGAALWRTDGTEIGTIEIKSDLVGWFDGAGLSDVLLFVSDSEVWRSDGSKEGTTLIDYSSVGVASFVEAINGRFVVGYHYAGPLEVGTLQLVAYDPVEGTVSDVLPRKSQFHSISTPVRVLLGESIHLGWAGNVLETDGTLDGTHRLLYGRLKSRAVSNGKIFFSPDRDYGLWVIDAGPESGRHVPIRASAMRGDINCDRRVTFADFLILSANFGKVVQSLHFGDADGDGVVAFADFLILSANFGRRRFD